MTGSTTIDEIKSGSSELSASEQQQSLIAERLASLFGDAVQLDNARNEMRLRCKVDDLLYVLKTVRDDPLLQFRQLSDLTAVDYPNQVDRFEVSIKCCLLP
jgi:NADH:ubiquinone oxidoreductase subunit C